MTAPLCAMWQGRCGRPAHLVIDTEVPIGDTWEPMSWLVCDDTRCWQASRWHAETFGLRCMRSRRVTPVDVAEMSGVAA